MRGLAAEMWGSTGRLAHRADATTAKRRAVAPIALGTRAPSRDRQRGAAPDRTAYRFGMANDVSPLVVFKDAGALTLDVDDPVDGPSGARYFFQGITPSPPGTLEAPLVTTAGYATMDQLIVAALAGGDIYGPGASGLSNSYWQQFAAVQADLASGSWAQALGDLESFVSHLQAQTNKHVNRAGEHA